ncbi:MAG: hypothetical protein ACJA1O_001873 [Spirosomataceae bacterium]|jgi:hypothetical protein
MLVKVFFLNDYPKDTIFINNPTAMVIKVLSSVPANTYSENLRSDFDIRRIALAVINKPIAVN